VSANGSNPRLDRIEKILEDLARTQREDHAKHERAIQQSRDQHDREMRGIRLELRRWAALGVKEARNQRKRQREIDLSITRLSAAQLVTEERLANLIFSLGRGGRGGNGGGRKSA
jgi:hypothetical protein